VAWMAGTSPAMTIEEKVIARFHRYHRLFGTD
jgi:hypothetical protein